MLKIEQLSSRYRVQTLTEKDIPAVFELCLQNPLYYRYCPPPVTPESVQKDLYALPPGKTLKDKYYIGFYAEDTLLAVMDLIDGFPKADTAFIGFFMVATAAQGKGMGTALISECCACLKRWGFEKVKLGYILGNPQSEHFWLKNGFVKTGLQSQQEHYRVIYMEKLLS